MHRRPLVAANWKMHGDRAMADSLVKALQDSLQAVAGIDVLLCPPHIYIPRVQAALGPGGPWLGAQNMHEAEQGAFTGEISAAMLRDNGCSHVILGHSERRVLFGETDDWVARKCEAALAGGLMPLLCVGETEAERRDNATAAVVKRQLDAVLDRVGADAFAGMVIAYEPVWAIGTGLTATPQQAQEVHALLRGHLQQAGCKAVEQLRILYGGSVKAGNAAALFAEADIDGALVGGASLVAEEFLAICRSAAAA